MFLLLFLGVLLISGQSCMVAQPPATNTFQQSNQENNTPVQEANKQEINMQIWKEKFNSVAPEVRELSISIVKNAPDGILPDSPAWKVYSLLMYTAENIVYISDPHGIDQITSPPYTLQIKAGDCEDISLLLATMYESVGLDSALLWVDVDGDTRLDHMGTIVYVPNEASEFLDEIVTIRKKSEDWNETKGWKGTIKEWFGLSPSAGFNYFPATSVWWPHKDYQKGAWIIADPLFTSFVKPIEAKYNILLITDVAK